MRDRALAPFLLEDGEQCVAQSGLGCRAAGSIPVPAGRLQACCHRWTERTLTRNSLAISVLPRRAANIAAASIRIRSRKACLSAVRPHPADTSYTRHTATITERQPLRQPTFKVSNALS